ncbi:hypothetical protein F5Y16DRAFT_394433 [Xylariaceae sp. FL0255]|nr:hypothetical protein F5Y16DRAFT_394433 [Xylariaceae sp. FL0255]
MSDSRLEWYPINAIPFGHELTEAVILRDLTFPMYFLVALVLYRSQLFHLIQTT